MGKTRIEWAEKTLPVKATKRKAHSFIKKDRWVNAFFVKPLNNVTCFFRAITGKASRNYIPRRCVPAFTYRLYMIPRSSRLATISTFAVELFHEDVLRFWRKRLDVSFFALGVLPSFFPIAFIRCVSFAGIFGMVFFAQSAFNFRERKPIGASTTPCKSFFSLLASFVFDWAKCFADRTTRATSGFVTAATGRILVKLFEWFPFFTLKAPFQSRIYKPDVFFQRDANFFSGYLDNARFTSHHNHSFLYLIRPFNYNIKEVF